jgi:tribbles-like protein
MLEGLEDVCVLDDEDNDALADKHGCPAYVSPEILNMAAHYSGKAADVWSLGVMLYTLLIGRYPFHDVEPSALFTKIRRGQYSIPDSISSRAKCLIRSLLRKEPAERLTAEQALSHPWFQHSLTPIQKHVKGAVRDVDQMVPDVHFQEEDSFFI